MSECSISDKFVYAETYDANEQNEDRYVWRTDVTIPIQNKPFHIHGSCDNGEGVTALAHIFAVMDGHGGDDCAEFVKNEVIDLTIEKLSELVYDEDGIHLVYEGDKDRGCSSDSDSNDAIVDSIKAVLVDIYQILDDRWFERISKLTSGKKPQTVCQKNGPWSVGCSSLLSVVLQLSGNCDDKKDSWWLFTAHCGDVRACLVDFCKKCNGDMIDEVFVGLTKDHTVKDKEEVSRICERTSDPNPIRKNSAGSYCVAGSLTPTRAIGDAYLKDRRFSFSPFKKGVPYITCIPDVSAREITLQERGHDSFLVICSDGIWENVSNDEIIMSLPRKENVESGINISPAKKLVSSSLASVCKKENMRLRALQAVRRGTPRRMKHDDMTALTVDLLGLLFR